MKEKRVKIPYIGKRRYSNLEVDYSMKRIIFTFEYAEDKTISWSVGKSRVKSYPNFHSLSEYDMWWFYNYTILPQMRQYFNFMKYHKMVTSQT
jgi:hypothetical protein